MALSIRLDSMSYTERISELRQTLELFEELEKLENYFKPLRNVDNMYMVEIRKIYAKILKKKGLTSSEIGRTFGVSYTTARRCLNNPINKSALKEVKNSYKKWINTNVYPVRIDGKKYSTMVKGNSDNKTFILKTVKKYAKENASTICGDDSNC